ncbi:ABC transporter substrate-binding protein [Amycolatopsis halotolerans]|uniref:ABC transporter substrate-binding protein n=1 Tax=Amycolatopsis halotolerans TaxID=330083 RepID=A0ABV7QJV9_9PSEU
MRRLPAVLAALVLLGASGCAVDDTLDLTSVAPGDHGHQGGTEVMLSSGNVGTADPMVNFSTSSWTLFTATYDGLTAFTKSGPETGQHVAPDLVTEIPKPTDGGLKWTFTLRSGIRFSDGREVRPADVKASFERMFKVHGPTTSSQFDVLAGAKECLDTPETCDLSKGISIDETTGKIVFTLTEPDPEFPQQLGQPLASILPADTPPADVGSDVSKLRSTGPYYWASYDPTDRVVMKRNPYFRSWSPLTAPEGNPDQIVQKFGLEPTDQVTAVINGQADLAVDSIPPDRLNEVSVDHPRQLHIDQLGHIWYWALNTRIPPFDNLKARQAVNYAFDRNSAVLQAGGPGLAVPTCQVLVPSLPGYQQYCPWTSNPAPNGRGPWRGPDLAKAKRLVAESGTAGAAVSVVPGNNRMHIAMGEYMQTLLTDLGYRATLKPMDEGLQFPFVQNSGNHVEAALTDWSQDYPAASDFLKVLTSCAAFVPNSDASPNIGGFCDPAIDARMTEALRLANTDPDAANRLWSEVDRAVTDQAPWVSMYVPKWIDFTSARLGNYRFSGQFGFLPGVAWLR